MEEGWKDLGQGLVCSGLVRLDEREVRIGGWVRSRACVTGSSMRDPLKQVELRHFPMCESLERWEVVGDRYTLIK